MEQTPAIKPTLASQLGVPEEVLPLLTPTQQGWIGLSIQKAQRFKVLQGFELKAQGLFTKFDKDWKKFCEWKGLPIETRGDFTPSFTLNEIQESVTEAKKIFGEAQDCRKQFTKMLEEKIISPSMEFEKSILQLTEDWKPVELQMRLQLNKKADAKAAYDREMAAFKTNITNEYYRMATEYKIALKQEINNTYLSLLEGKVPADKISDAVELLRTTLSSVPVPTFVKYQRILVQDAEARIEFAKIPAYNSKADLTWAQKEGIEQIFTNYIRDLQNSEVAIQAVQEDFEQEKGELHQNLNAEIAVNNLAASAEPFTMTGGPKSKVKKNLEVEVVMSEQWEIKVISAFLKNWQSCRGSIKSASDKLSVGQMAKALGKLATDVPGTTFEGLTLIEKSK